MHPDNPRDVLCAFSIVLALWISPVHSQQIYKCGHTYSDRPCSPTAKVLQSVKRSSAPKRALAICTDGPASKATIDDCLDQWRPILRDPKAAYATAGILGHYDKPGGEHVVVLDAYFRNGMGGYNGEQAICTMVNGHVDTAGTQSHKSLWHAFAALNVDQTPVKLSACDPSGGGAH